MKSCKTRYTFNRTSDKTDKRWKLQNQYTRRFGVSVVFVSYNLLYDTIVKYI